MGLGRENRKLTTSCFPLPKNALLELTEPTHFKAKLQEPPVTGDPTSSQQDEQLPSYNAYSIDGDVTAPLVYVNYGAQDDYKELERLGVSVKGAIVIARYGADLARHQAQAGRRARRRGLHHLFRPARRRLCTRRNVSRLVRSVRADGVQRGSVMDMPVYPGDPLTPGVGATKDAKRLKLSEVTTLTKIPTLPISYGDAQPLLAALTGPVAPENWRGALADYVSRRSGRRQGASQGELQLGHEDALRCDRPHSRLNVSRTNGSSAATITTPGSTAPKIPSPARSRCSKKLAASARLFSQGWRPKRTIVYCVWDGEEEALLGSTEWAEDHADELQRKAAVYINTDGNGRGFLNMSGSHTLEKFINGVARDVKDPGDRPHRLEASADAPDRRAERARPGIRRRCSRIARTRASVPICALERSAPGRTIRLSSITLALRR